MVVIEIEKSNGESYWTERFDNIESANRWIAEEKTRPYWNPSYRVKVTDNSAEIKAEEDRRQAEIEKKKSERNTLVTEAKALRAKANRTPAETTQLIEKIIDLVVT